jgi:mono/diheme cytochrome c family protein
MPALNFILRRVIVTLVAPILLISAYIGVAYAQGTPVGGTAEGAAMKNPVAATESSVVAGRMLYMEKCAACHGERGDGHGEGVGDYGKRPSDLTRPHYVYGTTDGDVFGNIQYGVEPSLAMPSWYGVISEKDIWHLVNYLRTLRKEP